MIAQLLAPLALVDERQERALLTQSIESQAAGRDEVSILEAGCGNSWQLDLHNVRYRLTGIDLNQDALDIRKRVWADLDQAIIGDLRTVDLEDRQFDVVYNSFVLEHIQDAERVLKNLYRWTRPGGLLILRIPDPRSVYGFLSRITPFWLHVLYKRRIAGIKTAGRPGHDPFPTVYDTVVSRQGIHGWCNARGLVIREEVGWNYQVGRPGIVSLVVRGAISAISLISMRTLASDHVNLTYVIEGPPVDHSPNFAPVAAAATLVP